MCPGVRASGNKSWSGAITKHGNRRIRVAHSLNWRGAACITSPNTRHSKQCRATLLSTKATGGAKKKAIVAVGRHLAIDLWRINTGRATAVKLGLQ